MRWREAWRAEPAGKKGKTYSTWVRALVPQVEIRPRHHRRLPGGAPHDRVSPPSPALPRHSAPAMTRTLKTTVANLALRFVGGRPCWHNRLFPRDLHAVFDHRGARHRWRNRELRAAGAPAFAIPRESPPHRALRPIESDDQDTRASPSISRPPPAVTTLLLFETTRPETNHSAIIPTAHLTTRSISPNRTHGETSQPSLQHRT